ncbi:hypothetical protein BGHDH14_bgh06609 [Blumeria hordei DH14]|uniref:Pentatricopeptide repeat protein n=1 Tax=Blumeria graminis f. sp. hordei (strain DH14) TaxID=546991 RepID=N1JNR1_BLUG1|nr:hypothetical protein BGHDH14_bgh06609 [Blumeria hordei DH14]
MLIARSRVVRAISTTGCTACLPFTTNMAGRGVEAATRKSLALGDIFATCYSTIFAIAALVDLKAKKKRRHEWDRLIAEARLGPSSAEESPCPVETDAQSQSLSYPSIERSSNSEDVTVGSAILRPRVRHSQRPKLNTHVFYRQFSSTYQPPDDISLSYLPSDNFADASLTAHTHKDPDPDAPERDITDPSELYLLQVNINNLVSNLLQKSTFYWTESRFDNGGHDIPLKEQLEELKQCLKSLETSNELLPQYVQVNLEIAKMEAREFNAILWNICNKARQEEDSLNLMMAKICYNLLISSVPPNIETYNILLNEFALINQHDLAEEILESFWYSRLRPNKKTIELIILHYKATKNRKGLDKIVKHMRGVEGDLMMSSVDAESQRPSWPSPEEYQLGLKQFELNEKTIRRQMRMNKLFYRSGNLYKKSPRDGHIFDALITAHLELKGLRAAARYVAAAVREGFRVKAATLCVVIRTSLQVADFTTSLKLLMIILSQWKISGYHAQIPLTPLLRHEIKRLLYFCGIDPERGVDGHLPLRITKYTEDMILQETEYPKAALRKLLHIMKIDDIMDQIDRISILIMSVGKALKDRGDFAILDSRVKEALRVLGTSSDSKKKSQLESKESLDLMEGRALTIHGLEANLVTTISVKVELVARLLMIRIQRCAIRLERMASIDSQSMVNSDRMKILQNLSIHVGIIHSQLKIETHLNLWWIRRLGFIATTFRSDAQYHRLGTVIRNLNRVELKTNTLWANSMISNGECHLQTE